MAKRLCYGKDRGEFELEERAMQRYEYKVIASPRRGVKAKGAKTNRDRFANALSELMNAQAREGWEYQRAESLPADEKPGLLKAAVEVYQSVLVFRRELASAVSHSPAMTAMRLSESTRVEPAQRAEPVFTAPKPHSEPVLTLGAENAAPELGPASRG